MYTSAHVCLSHTQPSVMAAAGPQAEAGLQLLHEAFQGFNDLLSMEAAGSAYDASKNRLQQLQTSWTSKGLYGNAAVGLLVQYRQQIQWDAMVPDAFSRFYRFVFHLCREPSRRNISTPTALDAWKLLLRGRFRLLDKWCTFVQGCAKAVITEDTWRQVLEFARTIHEDLSNYDAASAWAVMLDEFVEEVRASSRGGRAALLAMQLQAAQGMGHIGLALQAQTSRSGLEDGGGCCSDGSMSMGLGMGMGHMGGSGALVMAPVSPCCGSKRRGPDVDMVAEQLSAMPLDAGAGVSGGAGVGGASVAATPKRACLDSRGAHAGVGLGIGGTGASPWQQHHHHPHPHHHGQQSGGVSPSVSMQHSAGGGQAQSSSGAHGGNGNTDLETSATSAMSGGSNSHHRRSHVKIRRSGGGSCSGAAAVHGTAGLQGMGVGMGMGLGTGAAAAGLLGASLHQLDPHGHAHAHHGHGHAHPHAAALGHTGHEGSHHHVMMAGAGAGVGGNMSSPGGSATTGGATPGQGGGTGTGTGVDFQSMVCRTVGDALGFS